MIQPMMLQKLSLTIGKCPLGRLSGSSLLEASRGYEHLTALAVRSCD